MFVTDLSGKTALVTGASSGLGAHFARVLAGAGAQVILAARRLATLQAVAQTISARGGKVTVLALDITDVRALAELFDEIEPVDIVINNAGVVKTGAALQVTESDWDCVVDTNLKGLFFVAQVAARALTKARRGGSIINIASILGIRQNSNVLSYAVSKAGVIQMTKALALEWARHGVRVNALAPGYFATELNHGYFRTPAGEGLIQRIPQRRLGELSDLDGPLLLLASDHSRYMTGSTLVVDGGHLVSTL
jgi:NAD(P)-dependent dehydrogenase (short-subunit alcohol dehydrogenase family)